MSRRTVQELKNRLSKGSRPNAAAELQVLAKESALSLLERSIGFRHGRLAVVRLAMAANAGASIPPECWDYCSQVVAGACDPVLTGLFEDARRHLLKEARN